MKKRVSSPHPIRCSFCGRGQDEVSRLVSGPSVYICSECVKLCNDILEGEIERDLACDVRREGREDHAAPDDAVDLFAIEGRSFDQ